MFIFYIYLLRISFFSILYINYTGVNPMDEEMCLVDNGTTNSILREIKYFQTLTKNKGNVLTIAGRDAVIVGSRRATIMLPMGTSITIEDALLCPNSTRTLLSYRDIRKNRYHIETHHEGVEDRNHVLFNNQPCRLVETPGETICPGARSFGILLMMFQTLSVEKGASRALKSSWGSPIYARLIFLVRAK
jgi:hypothetical protein